MTVVQKCALPISPEPHGNGDAYGNILIYPDNYKAPKKAAVAKKVKQAAKKAVRKTARKAK